MRIGTFRMRLTLAAALLGGVTLQLWAQVATFPDQARNPFSGDPQAITHGAVLFRQECTYCHGGAGRGGKRVPGLPAGWRTEAWVRRVRRRHVDCGGIGTRSWQ